MNRADRISRAFAFAQFNHGKTGVTRKYTGEPYIVHPVQVAHLLATVFGVSDDALIQAALLHDVIEDTLVTESELQVEFGDDVADLVMSVTNIAKPEDGNRKARHAINVQKLSGVSARAQDLKLSDSICNLSGACVCSLSFGGDYVEEKAILLEVLTKGSPLLTSIMASVIDEERSVRAGMILSGLKTLLPDEDALKRMAAERVTLMYHQLNEIIEMANNLDRVEVGEPEECLSD